MIRVLGVYKYLRLRTLVFGNIQVKSILFLSLFLFLFEVSFSKPKKDKFISSEIAIKWARFTYRYLKTHPQNSPTYSSRGLGYAGLSMYESIVAKSKEYQSVAPSLNGLGKLPKPKGKIDLETVLNENQFYILSYIWNNPSQELKDSLISFHDRILQGRKLAVGDSNRIKNSRAYGKLIADIIFEWSKTDKGFNEYLHPFYPAFKWPIGPKYWVTPIKGQVNSPYPLHPYWGDNRTFVASNAHIELPRILEYSTDTSSLYYKDFLEIYTINQKLNQRQKEIAVWWADDPAETGAPGGHSYMLAIQLSEEYPKGIYEVASLFAKVGMCTADAFILCWKAKYVYNSERPYNYIKRNIDPNYAQFWPEPPFPAYPSGHATQVAAAATGMVSVFGDQVTFTDKVYVGREMDFLRNVEYRPRKFSSIWEAAEECGMSRLYGGIHTRQDNTDGITLGKEVGRGILSLPWKKK
ncbi:MAG: vanadium-dependent haloperoxidase [Leadbetterella sp.]